MSTGGSSTEHTRQGMESCQGTSRPPLHLQPLRGPAAAIGRPRGGSAAVDEEPTAQGFPPPLGLSSLLCWGGHHAAKTAGKARGRFKALKASQGWPRNAGQGAGRGHGTRQHDTESGPRLRRAAAERRATAQRGRAGEPVLGAGTQEHVQPWHKPGRQQRRQVLPCSLAHPAHGHAVAGTGQSRAAGRRGCPAPSPSPVHVSCREGREGGPTPRLRSHLQSRVKRGSKGRKLL